MAVVGLTLAAGALTGGAGTAVAQTANMAYNCRFPSGAQTVAVQVKVALPTAGTVGQVVSPGAPTVAVTIPRAALADVTGLGATSVGATEKLTVDVTQSGATSATSWQDLAAAQTALPQAGDLVLTASGVAQAVRPAASGKVTFVAGAFTVDLVPRKADGTVTSPPTISLSCAPVNGSGTTIGTVAVSGAAPPATAKQRATPAAAGDFCPPKPTGGLNPKFPRPPLPPDDPANYQINPGGNLQTCALVSGFSNVNKLNGAASLGGTSAVADGIRTILNLHLNYASFENIGVTLLEPRRSTLLTFGFVPVSATMEITQIGNLNIITVGPRIGIGAATATAEGEASLRLTDARVNGVPLNLGPNCHTAQPVELALQGSTDSDNPYRIQLGGQLDGEITIPPFAGCGVGEDLDPLLTASVSGPGNHIRITQGPLCQAPLGSQLGAPCPPIPYGFTVQPGGPWTATTDQVALRVAGPIPAEVLTCAPAEIKGNFRSGSKAVPTPLGQITDFTLGCTGSVPANTHFTVTRRASSSWKIDMDSASDGGTATGHLESDEWHFESPDCSFDAVDNGTATAPNMTFTYVKPTISFTNTAAMPSGITNVTGCTNGFLRGIKNAQTVNVGALNMTLNPAQTITQP